MGRKRNPERDRSKERYIIANGKISTEELAKQAGVTQSRIRQWKAEDKWDEDLKNQPKKRGGQKGNKNAQGKKMPTMNNNRNAVTHGAHAKAGYEDISEEAAEEIRTMDKVEAMPHMIQELQSLYLRKEYLEGLLKEYESPDKKDFYADRIIHVITPMNSEEIAEQKSRGKNSTAISDPENLGNELFKTSIKTIMKSSPFDRAAKVRVELDRVHGRIIRLLDSIKALEIENKRISLEEQRLELSRARLTGEVEIEPDVEEPKASG